ncbi:MAG TPA: FecR domain-containing protein [Rhizomicrobium sp.]|nr:FecR domain-containing protein [Rhizomicrobium sp.]
MTDHATIEHQASAWIERRDMGEWSAETQSQFDGWMNEALEHRIAYWRLEAAWNRTERMAALRPADLRQSIRPTTASAPRNTFKFAAALGLFAIVGAIGAYYVTQPTYQTFATTLGGREVLTLRDGSVIELNASTAIRLYDNAKERRVTLEKGEAYFNIQHDAAHPFVVISGNHRITDLGTKFSVRTEEGGLRVALMEGRAEVDNLNATRPVVLNPGEVAIATADSISVAKKPMRELADQLGWRRGQIIFYHTTLADAVAELNRYNRKRLVIADAATAHLTINGSFPTNGIDAFTQATEQVFGVRITHRGDDIIISR